jgi:phage protein D
VSESLASNSTTTVVAPAIQVGGQPLSSTAQDALVRTMIDSHLHLPGMFEITFLDPGGDLLTAAGISIGSKVSISGSTVTSEDPQALITGEVTGLEAICRDYTSYTIVRGYDLCHRLQRVRRTRTFLNQKDSDIARTVANGAGLAALKIEESTATHDFVGQCDQTDWDFLSERAREIGYETGMANGTFYFRPASSAATASGSPVELDFTGNLWRFLPRITAGNIAPKVEVRVWDPLQAKVIAQDQDVSTGTAELEGTVPASLAGKFVSDTTPAATTQPGAPAVGNLGPAPGSTAHVIYDRPVATGQAIGSAAPVVAASLSDQVASTFAEAEGEAEGNPAIQPGAVVTVSNVPTAFCGSWLITNARHIFDLSLGGYITEFVVSGRQERSLLGLASAGRTRPRPPTMPGVCCGIVTNVNDTQGMGQVKVALPWLSPDYETDWSSVAQFGAGKQSGALFLPSVGDEVLVGFEFGDPRRAYVLGGIVNSGTGYSLDGTKIGSAVKVSGETAVVTLRGFASPAKNQLVFSDQLPPDGSGPPTISAITLGTGDGKLSLAIDQVAGTVTLACSPGPPDSKTEQGTLNIQCGAAGTINVTAGSGGTVNIDGGANLNLKAQSSISIQSQGSISIQGSGQVAIKGAQIALN